MSEYPKMIYRLGNEFVWDGVGVDMRIVDDHAEESAAIEDGWSLTQPAKPEPEPESSAPRRGRPPKVD